VLAHRIGYPNSGQELKTVPYEPRDNIKDYDAKERPPLSISTHFRGWSHSNGIKKPRNVPRGSDAADKEEPS
jgi:hypothetical protein